MFWKKWGRKASLGRPVQMEPMEPTISKLVGRFNSNDENEFTAAYQFCHNFDIGLPEDFNWQADFQLECWKDGTGVTTIEMVVNDKVVASREII